MQKQLPLTLLIIGCLFCVCGCNRDTAPTDAQAAFEQDLLPILTARCALTGCHVDGGHNAHDLDLSSYDTFLAGGHHGSVFIPGNAADSEIVEKMVAGEMPPPTSGLPKVPDTEIQVFMDWINQQ